MILQRFKSWLFRCWFPLFIEERMAASAPELVEDESSFGSDELLHICDLCIQDNETIEAVAYCTVCVQYLCPACHKAHSRATVSKTHRTVTGNDMPVKEVRSKIIPTCSKHPGKGLVSFCKDHNVACCKECRELDHPRCGKQYPFPKEYNKDNLVKDSALKVESLQYLLGKFVSMKQSYELNLTDLKLKQKECIAKVKSARKLIDEHIDKLEKDTLAKINKTSLDATIDLETKITGLTSLIHELQTQVNENLDKLKRGSDEEIIVVMEAMSSEIEKYSAELQESVKTEYKFETTFSVSETVWAITNDISSFGEIELNKVKANVARDFEEKNPVYIGSIDLKSGTDTDDIKNIAMEILDEGQLLVSDVQNSKVKLFDCSFNLLDEIKLSSSPCGMTMLTPIDIRLSLLKEKCLQSVEIVDGIKLQPGIKNDTVLGYCKLLRYESLLVALSIGNLSYFLDLLDTDGKRIHRIRKESKENGIFGGIINIGMGPHGKLLCVCDKDSCTGMDLNGNILFRFQGEERQWAWYADICTFPEGYMFVFGKYKDSTSNGVMAVINEKGEIIRRGLQLKDTKPWHIKYNVAGNRLLVKPVDKNVLKMFLFV